jgi:RNA polymerase sigma-70 factor, ECF subfamily
LSTLESLKDEDLVARVSAGDKSAFRALAQRHGVRFRSVAYRFTRDISLAEDMVQEAFVTLWTKANIFDSGRAKFTTWFQRILVNKCLDEARKRKTFQLPEGYDAKDSSANSEEKLAEREVAARLRLVLSHLSERQVTAVTLSYFSGLSNQEAANTMALNIKAYESLLLRSRAKMRTALMKEKDDLLSTFA